MRGYRYSANGKCGVLRSDEGMTNVGSVRGFHTVILYDEMEVALDLFRFTTVFLRRFTVTTVLKKAKNIEKHNF